MRASPSPFSVASVASVASVSVLAIVAVAAVAPACTNAASSAAPDSGPASGSSSGSSGGGSDSGGSEGGPAPTGFYVPAGCNYGFNPQSNLGFTNVALDDEGAVSATNGVPTRVRLGVAGHPRKGTAGYADPSKMAAFTWETTESNHAAKVRYATSMAGLASGTVQTGYTWTVPASIGPAVNMHEVHVCTLTPNTHYYYEVGGGPSGQEVWSAPQDFMTMPAAGSSVTVGVFGDARDTVSVWQAVHERMKEQAPGLMVVPGDIVDLGANETLYAQWLDAIWKDPNNAGQFLTLGQQMIVPINGNHENDTADSFANWAIPADSVDNYPETYTSFDVGSVHFVLIDDEQISTLSAGVTSAEATAQLTWLKADLAAANADRAAHPFIVALSHRGMFSTSYHAGDVDVLATRGALAPLYDEYNVDLAINGHDHEYERSKPLHAGSTPSGPPVVGAGTTYVINAGAGADPYSINMSPQSYSSGVQVGFCGGGTACSSFPYIGLYAFITATATNLTMTAYGLKASSTSVTDDTMIDMVSLTAK